MRQRNREGGSVPPEWIPLWGSLVFASGVAFANPTGPSVVSGTATFQQSGNLLQVTNSPSTIINWQGFSIPAGEITRFNQQSAASAVLNRVTTQSPSAILGALQSNGRVFIVNPNGILFGASSQVDVAGLVASTLNLSDLDFLGGRLRFTASPGAGSVVNQGAITSAPGGQVYLVGPAVTNGGVITSPKGEVLLAAGNSVDLVDPQTPNLRVEITAPDNQVLNLGQITANAGRVGIYAGLINHSGAIRADSAVATEDGRIVFKATRNATLNAGSMTTANGPAGGRIEVQAGDTTLVAGLVESQGTTALGGTVHVLGNQVGLTDNARVNASGESGGGTVLIGGDFRGGNPDIQNAARTYFGRDAAIAANAIAIGDGGKVIIWSNDASRAYGSISAKGGAQSGNGGFVEISGRNWLDFSARVDTTAPLGATGKLLLDPTDITIGGGATSGGTCPPAGPCFDMVGDPSSANLNAADLIAALGTSNVTVSTSSGGSGAGDINVVTAVPYSSTNSLTLHADRDLNMVTFGGSIVNSGAGALTLEAGRDFNLRDAAVLALASPLSVSTGRDVNVTALTQPTLIQAGTLSMNAGGGLRVQAGTAPTARASVGSLNGQTINAGLVEVTAQANNNADISNFASGDQSIAVAGGGVGPGIDVQSLTSGGFASINNGAGSGAQTITVTDADHINLNGIGGGVSIFAQGGTQKISISGTGANAIVLRGGSAGSGSSALISANGSQLINAGAGGITLQAGSGGANNFVGINQNGVGSALTQTVVVNDGGSISIQGGSGGTINQAQIRAFGGLQSVTAGNVTLAGGSSSASNFALILAPVQSLTIHGDLTLSAGDSAVRVGGLGGATPSPTHLTLGVDGNVTMTGGSATNAVSAIGSSQVGGWRSDIAMNVGGNVALNPGSVAGAESRIGSPSGNVAGGTISVNAGGNIALNSAGPGLGTGIWTLDAVALSTLTPGKTITQGVDSIIRTDSLGVTANGDISLIGANQVGSTFSGGTGLGGSLAFNNTSPALTVPGISLAGGGALALNQAGNLFITGNVSSGAQTINASGDLTVAPFSGPGINVFASGPQAISAGGTLSVIGGSASNGFAQIMANGAQTMSASSVRLEGGSGTNAFSEMRQNGGLGNQTITVNSGGTLSLQGGPSGADNFAQIFSLGPVQRVTFPSGGGIVLTGGSGTSIPPLGDMSNNFARITTAGDQVIQTGSITLSGASAGANNFTEITGFSQSITTSGNVALFGNPAANSGSRIGGGPFVHSDTRLILHVGGDLTLNGGVLGAAPFGSLNNIFADAGGDITLNPGPGSPARIGSPSATGAISLAASGNIALNSAGPGLGSGIFTLGGVGLHVLTPGKEITQGVDSVIRAGSLGFGANGNVSLIGANQVASLSGSIGVGGGLTFNNTSPVLTLQGLSLDGGGALTINQAGNLLVASYVSSGAQTINASGDLTVAPPPFSSPGIAVNASGAQTLSAGGTLTVQGGSGLDASAVVTASGPTNVTVGNDLVLTGSSGQNAQALLFSNGNINLTIGGTLRMNAGSGDNAWARVQTATRESMINILFPNLSSGGYFVNDIEGALRRGFTGLLSGEGAASPGQTLEITYGQ